MTLVILGGGQHRWWGFLLPELVSLSVVNYILLLWLLYICPAKRKEWVSFGEANFINAYPFCLPFFLIFEYAQMRRKHR